MLHRTSRHFGMDWLRIGAFGLLILYHVGMAFVPWPFEIKVAEPRDWVAIPMLATNAWRLSLLFVVSGFASAALLSRYDGPGGFVRERLKRLGLPLLFAVFVLVTPQPWIALVTQHGYLHGFGHFLVHDYYRFQAIDGVAVPTYMHLWFVAYLLVYTIMAGAVRAWSPKTLSTGRRAAERALGGAMLLPLPILYVFLVRRYLPPGWIDTHAMVNDFSAHAVYLPCFLFGLLLQRSPKVFDAVRRWWRLALLIGLLAYGGVVLVELRWPGNIPVPEAWRPLFGLLRAAQMWASVIALVGLADRFLNCDHRLRATLAEAVFPFYLIHQTVILVVGYWLLPTPTGPLARFLILVVATTLGCLVFYLAGRRLAWLRPWIGLRSRSERAT